MITFMNFVNKFLARRGIKGLRWVVQDLGAIAMKGLNVIFLNRLADPLGMKLLEL